MPYFWENNFFVNGIFQFFLGVEAGGGSIVSLAASASRTDGRRLGSVKKKNGKGRPSALAERRGGGRGPRVDLEQVVAAIGQEAGVVAVMRALPYLLLARSFLIAQLRLGHRVEEAFMLVTGLFSANAQWDTRNHPAPFDLETWASQGAWRLARDLVSLAVRRALTVSN
ncbi:hypothetical protein [Chromobacterium sphagni]|uniref:hypothetical protein n=1 Tax=Chromobacterium sphagni TaxID=1903179 RepID=UPI0011134A0B|nr:hypothetical protein [Chromobacterium sphagni]